MSGRVLGVVIAGLLAGCGWWVDGRPSQDEPAPWLNFPHEKHVDFDILCWECHTEPDPEDPESASMWEPTMPEEEFCLECHYRDRECETCHVDPSNVRPPTMVDSGLGFDHGPHVMRAEGDCESCHTEATTAEALPLEPIPMDDCLGCHEHREDYDEARCTGCHPTLQYVPLEAIAEFEHDGAWMEQHGVAAANQSASCIQCHTESTCAECHSSVAPAIGADLFAEQVERTLLHRGDFVSVHGYEARANPDACVRCHEATYCGDCHIESGVSSISDDPLRVHPEGWMEPGGRNSHGREARLNITQCAACHDDGPASNCVECHRVGAGGGNPHPAGWDDRHDDPDESPMCSSCHL